mgnify:FL=1
MTDNWFLTACVLLLAVGLGGSIWMLWYEKRNADHWREYGRKIDGWTDEDWNRK